jgi:hypothetical protein
MTVPSARRVLNDRFASMVDSAWLIWMEHVEQRRLAPLTR